MSDFQEAVREIEPSAPEIYVQVPEVLGGVEVFKMSRNA